MLRQIAFMAAVTCCGSPVWGQVSAKITGPKTVAPGEILELKIEAGGDSSIFRLRPQPKKLLERYTDTGDKCLIWLPCPGQTYEAELFVYGVVDGKAKAVAAYHTVKVSDSPEPTPPPDPTPNPNPNPPTPPGPAPTPNPEPEDGRFGLAKVTYASAKSVNRPQEAKSLADAFAGTAIKVRAENPGILSLLSQLRESTSRAVPESSRAAWGGFNALVSAKLKALYEAGKLGAAGDWADCFEEIAVGLTAAAK